MSASTTWDDLKIRTVTGLSLVAFGIVVVSVGWPVFLYTCAVVTGIMVWELAAMTHPGPERQGQQAVLAVLATAAVLGAAGGLAPAAFWVPLLIPAVAGVLLLPKHRVIFALYALGIVVAGYGLATFREVYGALWLFWLVITVAVTDVAGYFAGRAFGGPKFWPKISPKKTWSGIVAGWFGAALVSLVFWWISDAGRDIVWIAALLSFASQMGDIAESAVKRKMGVKDSSNLLPGHGGLFDRFDGLLGASLFMLFTALIVDVPDLQW